MKRIIAAIILTLMIFAIGFTGKMLTNQSINYIQSSIGKIDNALSEGDMLRASRECNDFLKQWEKHHGFLCMYLQHEHLDPLENIFSVLPYYIEQEEIIPAQAECRRIISITEHVRKNEQITLENIL